MDRAAVLVQLVLVVVVAAVAMSAVGSPIVPAAVARLDPTGVSGMSHIAGQWHPRPPWPLFPGPLQQIVGMRMLDFAFEPSVVQVVPDLPITLELVNAGAVTHTLVIPVLGVKAVLAPGERRIVRVGRAEPGVYEFFCAMPAHRNAGMIGRLIVGSGILAR